VDRGFELVGEATCSFIAIVGLPRHGHNAEHGPFLFVWFTSSDYEH
jgi:hypothetical protein